MADFQYKHIIWDWNGTLLDDAWLCVEIMNEQLARRAMPLIDAAIYEQVFDFPVKDFYARLKFDFELEPFEAISNEWIAGYNGRVTTCGLRAGADVVLQQAQTMGLTQSILSASEQTHVREMVSHYGLAPYFDDVVGVDDTHAHGKVARGLEWLAEAQIDPAMTVYVGDTVHDAEVAAALGVDCVLIHSGHHSAARLAQTGVPVLDGLGALLENRGR